MLGWSQTELAEAAGLSLPTVKRFETAKGANVSQDAVAKLQATLEAAGIEFDCSDDGSIGIRLLGTTKES